MRKFLVVMDESAEFLNALYFAALRAEKTQTSVVILGVVGTADFQSWLGVDTVMREEAEERMRVHYEVFRKWMQGRIHIEPEFRLRYGDALEETIKEINEDEDIGLLILGASSGRRGPGPLVHELVNRRGADLRVPLTIVPENMSREMIKAIC